MGFIPPKNISLKRRCTQEHGRPKDFGQEGNVWNPIFRRAESGNQIGSNGDVSLISWPSKKCVSDNSGVLEIKVIFSHSVVT